MSKMRLKHLIVIIPGITGSVLRKDQKDVWAFSSASAWNAIAHRKGFLDDLKLKALDDPTLDDLGDGITASALMQDATIVPGLIKMFSGYTDLVKMIRGRFEIVGRGLESSEPTNFFEFPYDWRRDNRASARKLEKVVQQRLHAWREYTGDRNARVIFLVHSMGGLVARHYLEVLEGWRDCLALVSFGTPYRGSLKALDFLAKGHKAGPIDLTECLRSYTSVYQLLPTYPVISINGSCLSVFDIEIPNVDAKRAAEAADFHRKIADKVEEHTNTADYLKGGYKLLPFVGTRQPTLQSAWLAADALSLSEGLPPGVHELLDAGDGTVPRFSAVPEELGDEFRETFIPEKHGALQASTIILNDLLGRLEQMQVPRMKAIRGPELRSEGAAISLWVEDLYSMSHPIEFRARLLNTAAGAGSIVGLLSSAQADSPSALPVEFHLEHDDWVARLSGLPTGVYRLQVQTDQVHSGGPPPVHDLFEVIA